ncbi:MAG: hypothetical protein RL404_2782 [Pseudomonadota bacterium]
MQATPDARILQPVMQQFRSDGAPHVRLSSHKGLRNATILYEAIKNERGNTVLRADFDGAGKPRAIFAPGEKKDIAKLYATSPIKARNLDAERQDLANILLSIADVAEASDGMDQKSLCAAALLKKAIKGATAARRDIHVQEIREPLKTISNTYKRIELKNAIAQYRFLNKQASRVQIKRFKQFCAISHETFTDLSHALKPKAASCHAVNSVMAVYAMKHFIKRYQSRIEARPVRFPDYLRTTQIPDDVYFFAKRWIAISGPNRTAQRIRFDIHSWAREFDVICPSIIKGYRRQARVDMEGEERPTAERLLFQRPVHLAMPDLPPIPTKRGMPLTSMSHNPELVPKTPTTKTMSVAEPAHEMTGNSPSMRNLDESISLAPLPVPSEAEDEHKALSRTNGSLLITSPFQSLTSFDAQLINDMQALMRPDSFSSYPAPAVEYQPIRLPVTNVDGGFNREDENAGAVGRHPLPKPSATAVSGLSSGSLHVTSSSSHSTSSEILAVSSTEVISSDESNPPEKQASAPPQPWTLSLELSEAASHDGDTSL